MDFELSPEQTDIRQTIARVCADFGDDYWLERDRDGAFPEDFYQAIAGGGWLGIAMPERYGGAGLGLTEATIMMQAVTESGAAMSGASAVHLNIFGLSPVVEFATEAQLERFLPPLIAGQQKACFAVTEPDAGLDTTRLKTKAVRDGDDYVISGSKVWISTAQVADKMLILTRTTPIDEVSRPADGLTLFYADLDRSCVEVREIDKMGRKCIDSNQVFIDGLTVPAGDRIGAEGEGLRYLFHGLNAERIMVGAEAVGIGRAALGRAVDYAKERVVFGRPIGQNQAIQHPLAKCWMALEAANLMAFNAAALFDRGAACGAEANAAKYLCAEAAYEACQTAVMTHGGYGYAKEYQVERYLREVMIPRIAPVSPQMICNYISERVLGLPRSY